MTPKYSRSFINRIGDSLISADNTPAELEEAMRIFNDWRALHISVMNTFQISLRRYVKNVDANGIVAQRLKRTPTIIDKLKSRFQSADLGAMQDIAGLRAIVHDVSDVREVEKKYDKSQSMHRLKRKYDYISEPKESGYRGIHIVYENRNTKNPEYDGLLIEIQLRTRLQHLWATAVETVGFFFQESLKSSQGNAKWLEFFKLVSAVFAREEKQPCSETLKHLSQAELIGALKSLDKTHGIIRQLQAIQIATLAKKQSVLSGASYWVMETTVENPMVKFHPFREEQQDSADLVYRQLEQSVNCKTGKTQVVLVSVDSVKKLEKAYPNFFLDIRDFVKKVKGYLT